MRQRLDILMVERGLAESRQRARALVMEGKVLVGQGPAQKPGSMVDVSAEITLKGEQMPYVSRGGLKLEGAVDAFGLSLDGVVALDVGASTGGFTDFMLQRGASKVYAVDVGYGQFHWRLRNDPRVVLIERTNFRHMDAAVIAEPVGFVAIDVSFISLKLILPKVMELTAPGAAIICLVKPQFEVGRDDVGKGGIVRDEGKRLEALKSVEDFAGGIGLLPSGSIESPITGQKGNIEYLLYLKEKSHA